MNSIKRRSYAIIESVQDINRSMLQIKYDVSMLQDLQPLVMPNKPMHRPTVAMHTTLNIKRMSWADMCDSDVEDDDY